MQSYGGNATYMMQVDSAFEGFGCFSPLFFSFSSFRLIYTCFYVVYNFPKYINSHLPRSCCGNVKFGKCLLLNYKQRDAKLRWQRKQVNSAFEGFGCFSPLFFSFSFFRNIHKCFMIYQFSKSQKSTSATLLLRQCEIWQMFVVKLQAT